MSRSSSPGATSPNPHEPGWELWLYRRRRGGDTLTVEENAHLDTLETWYPYFEQLAVQHDELDERVRGEIARYREGYGWHKGPTLLRNRLAHGPRRQRGP